MARRNSRALGLVILGALALGLPACRIGSAGVRGIGALFAAPRKAPKGQNKTPTSKDTRLGVLWVGHATALVQIDDKVILTDPVFTSSVGQLGSRIVEPGIDAKDLPPIDAVLISHMHWDHFSYGSLEMIEPKVRALLLPSGGTTYLPDSFTFPSWELHTWQGWEKDGLRITSVPVDHVGFRYGIDDVPGERRGHPLAVDAVAEADVLDRHRRDAEPVLLPALPRVELPGWEREAVR